MWWTNSLCTPANEDLGTLAEYDPLTKSEEKTRVFSSVSFFLENHATQNEKKKNENLICYESHVSNSFQKTKTGVFLFSFFFNTKRFEK